MPTLRSRFARHGLLPALACALIALAPVAGHAALFEDDEARRALIELRGRFDLYSRDTNRRLDDLAARLDALTARADRLEQLASGQLDLTNQIAQLQQELARLRGQLEVQTNELAQTQRSQRDLFADLDTRVRKFEPVATHPAFQGQRLGKAVMAEGLRRMKTAGMQRAIVGFDPNNRAARALYTSLGFRASCYFAVAHKEL